MMIMRMKLYEIAEIESSTIDVYLFVRVNSASILSIAKRRRILACI